MAHIRYATPGLNAMGEEQIREFQEARQVKQVAYCLGNSQFYRRRFRDLGIEAGDIRTLDDWFALPVIMDKDQERLAQQESLERAGHPYGSHLCCAPEDVGVTGGLERAVTKTPMFEKRYES